MASQIVDPFQFFTDRNGDALDQGYVYIGTSGSDPELFPQACFFDEALTVAAAQPLRTVAGYIVNPGAGNAAADVFTANGAYSIRVRDKQTVQIFYKPVCVDPVGKVLALLAAAPGAGLVGFSHANTYVAGTLGNHDRRFIVVTDAPFNASTANSAAANTTAFNLAITTIASGGGGGDIYVPSGQFAVNDINDLPDSVGIIGCGMFQNGSHSCVLKYAGSGRCLKTTSRNIIKNIRIEGPPTSLANITTYTGAAATGIIVTGGYHRLENVWIWGFAAGLKIDQSFWGTYQGCVFTYNIRNVTFDTASQYSTTQLFLGCTISNAQKEGIKGVTVPIRNVVIQFVGGSIESNVQDNTAVPQVDFGSIAQLYFNGVYFEDTKATKSDTITLTAAGEVTFTNCYFNGANKHILANSGSPSYVTISACRFLGTAHATLAVDLANCNYSTHFSNETDKTILITGTGVVELNDGMLVRGTRVVGPRATGWVAPTGTANRATFATFTASGAAVAPSAAYVQAEATTVANRLQAAEAGLEVASRHLKALIDDLTTHGLIGT
jgi:hypothetical protein